MGIKESYFKYQECLKTEMQQWLLKDKRSYEEFKLMNEENQKNEKYRQKLLTLYEENYQSLKSRKFQRFHVVR